MRSSSDTRRWCEDEGPRVLSVAAAVIGAGALGAVGSYASGRAASNDQKDAAQQGISEQNQQFAAVQKLLAPYVQAGTGSLTAQQNLIGLNGNDAQGAAISALQASPAFASAQQTGNDAILAKASATGGLRGGNVQAALGQFSPALLSSLINDQYTKLGGLTSTGESAAAGVGNAGLATGNQVTQLLQQQGAAGAGGDLAAGRAFGGLLNAGVGAYGIYNAMNPPAPAPVAAPISSWAGSGAGFGPGNYSYGF